MKPVIVKNVKIGEGMPKICVPIVGVKREDIIREAETFHRLPLDIVEWRVDWYEDVFDMEKVLETAELLQKALGETPVLFTFRTAKEGGKREIDTETYKALNLAAARSGFVDLVDVEAFTGEEVVTSLIEQIHEAGVKVVASNHDFDKTPAKDEIIRRLCKMQEAGADIPKIAVMPQSRQDVLVLLAATLEMSEKYADRPIITMSMAADGVVSRLCGETFGSALTFGAADKASAPGQVGVEELAGILKVLHR